MHISKFRIQNFKSFEDVTLHFNESVNILTGVNNSGKTSVLEALALWQECYALLLQPAGRSVSSRYTMGQFILGTQHATYINYTDIISVRSSRYSDIFRNLDPKGAVYLTATLSDTHQSLDIGFWIRPSQGQTNYNIRLIDFESFDFQIFNDKKFLNDPRTAINATLSIPVSTIPAQEEIKIPNLIRRYITLRNSREVLRNRIRDLKNRFQDKYFKFLGNMQTILTGSPNSIDLSITENQGIWVEIDIILPNQVGMNLELMGSGTIQIIELLLAVYEQESVINMILLDEPDSHIHRQLQRRLLRVIEDARGGQLFLTTHNEALIRDAKPEWLFHLEQQPVKEYKSIQRNRQAKPLGLLSSAVSPIIQTLAGEGSGLDFINALEADVLFMVEGVNDALRIQKLLSFIANDRKKYAFWVLGSVDEIFDKIVHYKNVFEQIKNDKNLWEKTILIFDKDFMTDLQREKLLFQLKKKLNNDKIYAWESYNFDSVLFSDLDNLNNLIEYFLRTKQSTVEYDNNLLSMEMQNFVRNTQQKYENGKIQDFETKVKAQILPRRTKLENMQIKGVVETEDFTKAVDNYLKQVCNINEIHKIMDKDDCEIVLKNIFAKYGLKFSMEGVGNDIDVNFNILFSSLTSSIVAEQYNQIRTFIR